MNDVGVAGRGHRIGVDLVRAEQLDAFGPHLVGLTHRDPDVGEQYVTAGHALRHVIGQRHKETVKDGRDPYERADDDEDG
jgi:hypothetical protein